MARAVSIAKNRKSCKEENVIKTNQGQFYKMLTHNYCKAWDSIPMYILRKNENICSHKNLYMNGHSSIIHNSQKVKTIQMSIS